MKRRLRLRIMRNVAQEAVASDEENADTQQQAEDSTEGAKKAS